MTAPQQPYGTPEPATGRQPSGGRPDGRGRPARPAEPAADRPGPGRCFRPAHRAEPGPGRRPVRALGGAPPAPVDQLCTDLKPEVYGVPSHYWRGDGNASDSIGGVDGTLQGATSFGQGEAGQAFEFGSQGDAVTFGSDVGNFGTDDFTVDFWLQT